MELTKLAVGRPYPINIPQEGCYFDPLQGNLIISMSEITDSEIKAYQKDEALFALSYIN